MKALANRPCALRLLHEGSAVLARVESNGMRTDLDHCREQMKTLTRWVGSLERQIKDSELWAKWKGKYGSTANVNSGTQLGDVLFNIMGYPATELTESGRPSVKEAALERIDDPIVQLCVRRKKYLKVRDTYLKNIIAETTDGLMHPIYNLHVADTFRSSSDSPNFQNFPVRNKRLARMVRSAIIPRPGRRIVETDFSGLEVAIAACYHKDPNMILYLKDKTKDMHRDMASACYKLPASEVTKDIRYCGKNMFVFPQFYGSYYVQCAPALWDAPEHMKLVTTSGKRLRDHLNAVGLRKRGACKHDQRPHPGTFEDHIRQVENGMWNDMFPVYARWKKNWYQQYVARGHIDSLTGFRMSGLMSRNDVINYPVQGSAFHALLWSLIELQKELDHREMKTLIIGQIHDSIVADVPAEEFDEYLGIVDYIMSKQLPQEWKWVIVPLEVETEATPVDGSWWLKKKVA